MSLHLQNAQVMTNTGLRKQDLFIYQSKIYFQKEQLPLSPTNFQTIDLSDLVIIPGLVDVHVHLREPGFSYKETILSGTNSAAKGGYTHVCTMPNLLPPPSNLPNLQQQLDIIKQDAVIRVTPYGTITKAGDGRSELVDMALLKDYVCAFSDDGKGIQEEQHMKAAMELAQRLNMLIVAHCEDESLVKGGYIHAGEYAQKNGHLGIDPKSEWIQIERDCRLSKETGCAYHVCHVSSKKSIEIIREAKKQGVNVTCETAPHYLLMNDLDLQEEGRFKMNPPLRGKEDQQALIEACLDGTIDMIATDHAPHSAAEKSRGLKDSLFGIHGFETAFGLLYKYLVLTNKMSFSKLIELMCIKPRKRFNLPGTESGLIEDKGLADITVLDLNKEEKIKSAEFISQGKATPFEGWVMQGIPVMTIVNGQIVYKKEGL